MHGKGYLEIIPFSEYCGTPRHAGGTLLGSGNGGVAGSLGV
jgi:hypothetical protein